MLLLALLADLQENAGWITAAVMLITALGVSGVKFYKPILDWLLNRKKMDFEQQQAEDRAQFEREQVEERTARDEYRDLYNELKVELAACRRDHLRSDKRCSRLEAALVAHGIPLPPLEGSGDQIPLQGDQPKSPRKRGQ